MRPVESELNTAFTVCLAVDGIGSPVIIKKLWMSLMAAPKNRDRIAIAFRSRQQICGITLRPVAWRTLLAMRTESTLVRPDGESGNVRTSTPAFFKRWADSKSFSSSASKGGAKFYRDELFLFPLSVFIVKESMSLDMSRLLPIIRLCIQDNLV